MHLKHAAPLLIATALLTACEDGGFARIFSNTAIDVMRGEPDADALAQTRTFRGAGIRFDYPAVLRKTADTDDDGDRTWSFEYGMFELELYAPKAEVEAADYLGLLGEIFSGGKSLDAEPIEDGRSETLCGHALTSTRLRMKIMDDWSEMEAFDLPAPPGEARLLIFDDEPVAGQPSAVARATWERVLGSLQCDAAFSLDSDSDVEDEGQDEEDEGLGNAHAEAGTAVDDGSSDDTH